jgi:hypothetical protein
MINLATTRTNSFHLADFRNDPEPAREPPPMKLDSALELKAALTKSVIDPLSTSAATRSALGVPAQPMAALGAHTPTIALGIGRKAKDEFVLAVRLQRRAMEDSPQLEAIRKQAKGEVDVRYIGRVSKLAAKPWHQRKNRPLRVGGSVGHFRITAGTLGCFVQAGSDGPPMILSNNHVLADEDRGKKGDAILQPGPFDGGKNPADRVATLTNFIRFNRTRPNLVDAAAATLAAGMRFNAKNLTGLGTLTGLGEPFLEDDELVGKVGRTTGTTRGRVTAFDMDNVMVQYDVGVLRFDNQIEIEGVGTSPFSRGGDSGSLIVDGGRRGVGLLFAGGDVGGSNGMGLTYANPLRAALDALKVSLLVK